MIPEGAIAFLKESPDHIVALFFLTLCRLVPIVSMAPFFGARVMPAPARIAFSVCLFFILLPHLLFTTPLLTWSPAVIFLACKEVMVGYLIGFLVSVPFQIAQMSGVVIDFQRGSSSLTGQDLLLSTQSSANALLYNSILICVFYWVGGPFIFLDSLFKSFTVLPVDHFVSAQFFTHSHFWPAFMGLLGKMFALACQLAAPSLLTILMTDTFLGIINRLAQQVQISFLGQGLKAYLGDVALWLAWLYILDQLGKFSLSYLSDLTDFMMQIH